MKHKIRFTPSEKLAIFSNDSDETLSPVFDDKPSNSQEGRSPAYKRRILDWLASQSHGATTTELKEQFPMIRLIEMERRDNSIEYRDCRWNVVADYDSRRQLADLEPLASWVR